MSIIKWLFLQTKIITNWRQLLSKCLLLLLCLLIIGVQPAFAGMKDDRYEGNIFVVFAGNGSLVPPRQSLAKTLAAKKPAMLAFYVDDSSDCKQYAVFISQTQAYYGRAVEIIPVSVDTIPSQEKYDPTEPGYYYSGKVPQVVLFDDAGKVILNKTGQVPFEEIDDKFRGVFNLLPRDESIEFKQRSFNEYSSELSQ
ncbi:thylakoid membrane photosystem I accumulation factor [Okeanomitos corallinicola TIOX110]|uniref:Thylakoid membrane photosystem I accumulation factor n=1 Tax=Okeanomitos corallinicola TIOX110 TaxID=3133117 RepID=A0ABZ2UUN3_9CYAN